MLLMWQFKTEYMKLFFSLLSVIIAFIGCVAKTEGDVAKQNMIPITGTWKLITGTLVEKGNTVVTDYTKNISFIKILNNTHFAFLQHDLNKGKDSVPVFVSVAGLFHLKTARTQNT